MQRWPCRAADAARVVAGRLCAPRSGGTRITLARFSPDLPILDLGPDFPQSTNDVPSASCPSVHLLAGCLQRGRAQGPSATRHACEYTLLHTDATRDTC